MKEKTTYRYVAYKSEVLSYHESLGLKRKAQLGRLRDIILAGGTAIVAAPSGFGKTRAAGDLADEIARRRGSVVVMASSRMHRQQFRERVTTPADLLVVEDVHLLDPDDVALLVRLAMDPSLSVLMTLDPVPAIGCAREEECRRELTWLWNEGGVERVDLGGVGYNEAVQIVDAVTGGKQRQLDIVTRARIIHLSEGSPRLLKELTLEQLHNGTYSARQQNLMLGPSYLSPRIIDVVRPRLQDLDDDEVYGLITLGRLGSTPFLRAARLIGHGVLQSLLRRGLVSHDSRTPDCVEASRLFAGAALAMQTSENPSEARHAAETVLLLDVSRGMQLTSSECAFVAEYLMNDPSLDPLDDMTMPEAASLFARAARHANENGMPGSARMFAHRSVAYGPTVMAVEELSRCLVRQGKFSEALDVLERVDVPHTDKEEDAVYVGWWFHLLARNGLSAERVAILNTTAQAWGTVDSELKEWSAYIDARSRMLLSSFTAGIDQMESIASDPATSPALTVLALAELLPCYVYLGETTKFERAHEKGWAIIAPSLAERTSPRRRDRTGYATEFIMQASLVRSASGHGRAELARELESYALRMVDNADEYGMSLVNLVAGHLAIEQNQGQRAEAELRRALERVGNGTQTRWTTWMQLLRANALAMTGKFEEAFHMEREIPTWARQSSPWLTQYSMHLEATMKAYEADPAGSIDACQSIASSSTPQSRFFAMRALHVAAALGGDLEQLVKQIDALPPVGDAAASTVLLESHIRGALYCDAALLRQTGTELLALELWWEGYFALRTAATLFAAEGRIADERACQALAAPYTQRLHEAMTILSSDDDAESIADETHGTRSDPEVIASLTRREREVALLAADGHSNAEIAARLYLSVRTVESHVLQARSKLGDVRRADLGDVLKR